MYISAQPVYNTNKIEEVNCIGTYLKLINLVDFDFGFFRLSKL